MNFLYELRILIANFYAKVQSHVMETQIMKTWVHKLTIMLNGRLQLYTFSLTFIAQAEKYTVKQYFMSVFTTTLKKKKKKSDINQKSHAFSKLA